MYASDNFNNSKAINDQGIKLNLNKLNYFSEKQNIVILNLKINY